MIRLDLSNEPAWLDLGHGVRLHLQPPDHHPDGGLAQRSRSGRSG